MTSKKRPILSYLRRGSIRLGPEVLAFITKLVEKADIQESEAIVAALHGIPHANPMSSKVAAKRFNTRNTRNLNLEAKLFYQLLGRLLVESIAPKPREWWEEPVIRFHAAWLDNDNEKQTGVTLIYPDGTEAELPPVSENLPHGQVLAIASEYFRTTWDPKLKKRRESPLPPAEPKEPEEPEIDLSEINLNLFKSVDEMGLSARSINCLHSENIKLIGELVQRKRNDMLIRANGFGPKSLKEVKVVLASMGLSLGMTIENWPKLLEQWKKKSRSNPNAG
jgi:hypothetical protein